MSVLDTFKQENRSADEHGGGMTRLLVSVRDVAEARQARAAGAALIDAKEPLNGSLGALPAADIRAIVAALGPEAAVSAVAADHADIESLVAATRAIAGTGVSFIKVGLRAPLAKPGAIARIGGALEGQGRIVAVLFADEGADVSLVEPLARAGFAGAMIDTYAKDRGRLSEIMPLDRLSAFVAACRRRRLMSGLAGSLRIEDIDDLVPIGPDYLGFRGGLCRGPLRHDPLDSDKIRLAADRLASLAGANREAVA